MFQIRLKRLNYSMNGESGIVDEVEDIRLIRRVPPDCTSQLKGFIFLKLQGDLLYNGVKQDDAKYTITRKGQRNAPYE